MRSAPASGQARFALALALGARAALLLVLAAPAAAVATPGKNSAGVQTLAASAALARGEVSRSLFGARWSLRGATSRRIGATRHLLLLQSDARVSASFGRAEDDAAALELRLSGYLSGGVQLYYALPLQLFVEDLALVIEEGRVWGRYFLGSGLTLPIDLLAGLDGERTLQLTAAVGARSSDLLGGEVVLAFAPLLRYLGPHAGAELYYAAGSYQQRACHRLRASFTLQDVPVRRVRAGVEVDVEAAAGRRRYETTFFLGGGFD